MSAVTMEQVEGLLARLRAVEDELVSLRQAQTTLQNQLDDKANVGHTHAISDVTDLATTLAGKASATHSHAISDVTGLTGEVAKLANVGVLQVAAYDVCSGGTASSVDFIVDS